MPNILETITTQIKLSEASPEIIKAVQQCLNITVDGICGVQTILTFHGFKKRYNLEEPDYLGATTAKKLLEVSNKKIITEVQAETIFGRQITTAQLNDLNSCLQRFEINTPERIKSFTSQVGHESCGLKYNLELASGAAYEGRLDLGNTCRGDGVKFKGCGWIQVTGRHWHTGFGKFVNDPKVLELGSTYTAGKYPASISGYWWMKNGLNKLIDSGASIEQITRKINGGINGLTDRKTYYARASKVLGA